MPNQTINPSTTSLQSTDTSTSTTPLTQQGNRKKNYPFAFANLQKKYGTTGNLPSPMTGVPPHSSSSSIIHDASNSPTDMSSQPGPSKSSSLSTIQEQAPSSDAPKNFEAAFGSLSSSYGVSSALPTLPRKVKDSEKEKKQKRSFASSLFKKGDALRTCFIFFLIFIGPVDRQVKWRGKGLTSDSMGFRAKDTGGC